jgi:hypothetical protein
VIETASSLFMPTAYQTSWDSARIMSSNLSTAE